MYSFNFVNLLVNAGDRRLSVFSLIFKVHLQFGFIEILRELEKKLVRISRFLPDETELKIIIIVIFCFG